MAAGVNTGTSGAPMCCLGGALSLPIRFINEGSRDPALARTRRGSRVGDAPLPSNDRLTRAVSSATAAVTRRHREGQCSSCHLRRCRRRSQPLPAPAERLSPSYPWSRSEDRPRNRQAANPSRPSPTGRQRIRVARVCRRRHRRGRVIGRFLWRIVSLHKRRKVFAGCCIRLKMFQISARPTD